MPLFRKQKKAEEFKRIEPGTRSSEIMEIGEPDEEPAIDPRDDEIAMLKRKIVESEKELLEDKTPDVWEVKQIPIQHSAVLYNNKTKEEVDVLQALAYILNNLEE